MTALRRPRIGHELETILHFIPLLPRCLQARDVSGRLDARRRRVSRGRLCRGAPRATRAAAVPPVRSAGPREPLSAPPPVVVVAATAVDRVARCLCRRVDSTAPCCCSTLLIYYTEELTTSTKYSAICTIARLGVVDDDDRPEYKHKKTKRDSAHGPGPCATLAGPDAAMIAATRSSVRSSGRVVERRPLPLLPLRAQPVVVL